MQKRDTMRALLVAGLMLAVAAPGGAQVEPRAFTASEAQHARLESGEILVEVEIHGQTTHGRVAAVVDASPDSVWGVVADFGRQDEWIPDMYDAVVLSGDDERFTASAAMRVPFPLRDRVYTLALHNRSERVGGADGYVSSWSYVEGNMLSNAGYWFIRPWEGDPGRSLVVYEFEAGSGIRSPSGIERNVTERMLASILDALRVRVVESGS